MSTSKDFRQYVPGSAVDFTDNYKALKEIYVAAVEQAAQGKGKDRHANDEPFEDQLMFKLQDFYGAGGALFQANKKMVEAKRLLTFDNGQERAEAELLGALNYLAGAVIHLRKTGSLS